MSGPSSSRSFGDRPEPGGSRAGLGEVIRHIGHLLPAQGPISIFIHHNPLHAFEHLAFEQAVTEAAHLFGCEPFLAEQRYRDEIRRGRIHESDINAELETDLGEHADRVLIGEVSGRELRRRILLHGLQELSGPSLVWALEETNVLKELRRDLPPEARESMGLEFFTGVRHDEEAHHVRALWSECRRAVEQSKSVRPGPPPKYIRHRDLLLSTFGIDVDEWVHPVLSRVTGAYLDQGLADWPMPGRERGMFACFLDLYRHRLASLCRPFGRDLRRVVRREVDAARDGWSSLEASLSDLGVPASEQASFLLAEALAMRGFAGMVHQFELRPDRVPAFPIPARLVDFLATRMLLLRAALAHAARSVDFDGEPSGFRDWLHDRLPVPRLPSVDERAWTLFQLAQLSGSSARNVAEMDTASVALVEQELRDFDGRTRRAVLHRAYERHLRHRLFDALVQHEPAQPRPPSYQAIFCIDEREESMRRHLEEIDPAVETFGVAGFFGVAMYYQGSKDAHARPSCPVAVLPRHFVSEADHAGAPSHRERWRRLWERLGTLLDRNVHLGGRRARRGAVLMATIGVLWVIPLVLHVVFPWLRRGIARLYGKLNAPSGRLVLAHRASESPPPAGEQIGFSNEEMAAIVASQLLPIGIENRFAPLVLVLGHGSTSLNNPHESAHDCGACGGGRGGPNARAFAQMANEPAVRALVAERGLHIPEDTWFIGGERNTANNDVDLFDEDLAPEHVRELLDRAREDLEEARRRDAHERCRRFDSAAAWLPPAAALLHVQARATDLAQPRPEYGHATNAACIIGRRLRTRGLFLDRRAFLVSYDPETDADGTLLEMLLSAVVPVVAGISLEYLFGYVDGKGYGSGTKLPHNVTALVGVMDGALSDLRTGLPWQMLEIHEPVRLSLVVEANPELVERLLRRNSDLQRLVDNRWIFLAALDPNSDALISLGSTPVRRYRPEREIGVSRSPSQKHYEGRRGHLPFVAIGVARGVEP